MSLPGRCCTQGAETSRFAPGQSPRRLQKRESRQQVAWWIALDLGYQARRAEVRIYEAERVAGIRLWAVKEEAAPEGRPLPDLRPAPVPTPPCSAPEALDGQPWYHCRGQNPETQLRQLREYAERRGFSVVQEYVLAEFEGLGIDFISYNEGADTTTPQGKLLFGIMASLAEFERSLIAERAKRS
jgi:Resolvase, N terminal domain